jgi:hypothetical protein
LGSIRIIYKKAVKLKEKKERREDGNGEWDRFVWGNWMEVRREI